MNKRHYIKEARSFCGDDKLEKALDTLKLIKGLNEDQELYLDSYKRQLSVLSRKSKLDEIDANEYKKRRSAINTNLLELIEKIKNTPRRTTPPKKNIKLVYLISFIVLIILVFLGVKYIPTSSFSPSTPPLPEVLPLPEALITYQSTFEQDGQSFINKRYINYGNPSFKTKNEEYSFSVNSGVQAFFDRRYDEVQDVLDHILQEYPTINKAKFFELQARAHQEDKSRVIHPDISHLFTTTFDSAIAFDPNKKIFTCKLGIGYRPKNLLFPKKLKDIVYQSIADLLKEYESSTLNKSLNTQAILGRLAKDKHFISTYCNELKSNMDYYELYHNKVEVERCKLFYTPGEYQVNPISSVIIQAIAEICYDYARIRPDIKFKLICTGHSDGTSVGPKGLPHNSKASWSAQGDTIDIFNPTQNYPSITNPTLGGHNGNHQLAFIRAHTGILQVKTTLESNPNRKQLSNLELGYTGVKPPKDNISNKNKRRIEFKLIQL